MRTVRILFTGGGTGGHIYPLLAVAERLQELVAPTGADLDLRYYGNPGSYRGALEARDIRVQHIAASKLRRYFDLQNFIDVFRFAWGLLEAWWKLFWFMPDVAFSKGGPGALAVVTLCRFYRIPFVVHESDAVPGITNIVSAKAARLVELGFPEARERFKTRAAVKVVGVPVRRELLKNETPETGKSFLNFDPAEPLILVLGGSQGAERLNTFVLENISALAAEFQVLHQTGRDRYAAYEREYAFLAKQFPSEFAKRYRFVPYLEDELPYALAAADLVVSRAGASAIFEIAALAKPSILIPLASAANDHQRENAYTYAKRGAALVMLEENLLPALFLQAVQSILSNREKMLAMSEAARSFFIPDADLTIANDLLALAGPPVL